MRLSSVFVVIVATFLVSCDAASTAANSKASMLVQSLDVAPVKSTRFLRKIETEEEEEEDSETEERDAVGDIIKNFKPSKSYLNHPLLRPQAEVLAAAKKADDVLESKLLKDKVLVDIMKKIKNTSGAKERIKDWVTRGVDPTAIARLYRTKYPTLNRNGAEWASHRLYSALFLKNAHKDVNLN